MKGLVPRSWLTENEKMSSIAPKEYYQKAFKELLQEIKENVIEVQDIITIKK